MLAFDREFEWGTACLAKGRRDEAEPGPAGGAGEPRGIGPRAAADAARRQGEIDRHAERASHHPATSYRLHSHLGRPGGLGSGDPLYSLAMAQSDNQQPRPPASVFDRGLVRRRRERAVAGGDRSDFLFSEVASRVADRLNDVKRSFSAGLDLGSRGGHLARAVLETGRVERLYASDPSPLLARQAAVNAVAADEEALPFADGAFDLVLSSLALHWVNDLPGTLLQIRRALRPDGLFLGAMLGGETLAELREVLMEAELAVTGKAGSRISPMAALNDAAGLLGRAGFALPVADRDLVTVAYSDALALMRDLSRMGEGSAAHLRAAGSLRRAVIAETARLYERRHHYAGDRVRASFEIIYLSGWAPSETQQKPLQPGAAKIRLADALDTVERPAGDTTPNPIGA